VQQGRNLLWNTRVKDGNGFDVFIASKDAASYIDEDFAAMLSVFYTTQNLECLPFSGGWAEQPLWIAQALEILKTEKWKADVEEREQERQEAEDARKYGRR
jgi:hypothetical protein